MVNQQYNVSAPGSLPAKIATHQRRKMFAMFLECANLKNSETILDVGVTSDRDFFYSNYLEIWYPNKSNITAIGIDDASFLVTAFPGMSFVRGDGRALPFGDRSFDFVHSSAVLEHVGSRHDQTVFLRELWRVAGKGLFVATPNRSFPIEFHTVLPLLHWLPAEQFRMCLRILGKEFFAAEENLNLLSQRELSKIAADAGIAGFQITGPSLLGWQTNLVLYAER